MASPLLDVLRDPSAASALDAAGWELLLRQARAERLHARLAWTLDASRSADGVPDAARRHLRAYRTSSEAHDRSVRWEVDRIAAALRGIDAPVVLLKGAAYLLSGLPVARGRIADDVDILVPKDRLGAVEAALLAHGFEHVKVDPYEQKYYRRWMHELPPLRHPGRDSMIDVHHTILPETSRLRPDAAELIRASRPLEGAPGVRALAPTDLVLHSAAHLFHDGAFERGLRDLVDLDDLLRTFSREPGFWDSLVGRGARLDLGRPMFYVLRYASRLLGTPVPAAALAAADAHRPGRLALALMDRLVPTAVTPEHPERTTWRAAFRRWELYVRSHWLRMPPWLLARHLATQGFRRLFGGSRGLARR